MSSDPDANPRPADPPSSLVHRGGWVRLYRADVLLIGQEFRDCAASMLAVWIALLMLENQSRTEFFRASISRIAHLSAVSRSSVKRSMANLQRLGLVDVTLFKTADGLNEENGFQLKGSVHNGPTGRSIENRGVGSTTCPQDEPLRKEGNIPKRYIPGRKKGNKISQSQAAAPANAAPPPDEERQEGPRQW